MQTATKMSTDNNSVMVEIKVKSYIIAAFKISSAINSYKEKGKAMKNKLFVMCDDLIFEKPHSSTVQLFMLYQSSTLKRRRKTCCYIVD